MRNKSHVEAHAIQHEDLNYAKRGSSKYFLTIKWIHIKLAESMQPICSQNIVFHF
jgi:hypothetical protein